MIQIFKRITLFISIFPVHLSRIYKPIPLFLEIILLWINGSLAFNINIPKENINKLNFLENYTIKFIMMYLIS